MERVLEKMAKQLNAYDEASLMQLWQQFAMRVHEFEPSKRWEEAVLILSFIQAVRWKNQLFNYQLATAATPLQPHEMPPMPSFASALKKVQADSAPPVHKKKATVLPFPPK